MYVNYQNVTELYHYGIKGQKWGIIRKDDDQETRLASEKNRLKYDEKVAKIKSEQEKRIAEISLDSKTAITLGKQELAKSFSQDDALRKQSSDERKAKELKYKMIGTVAIIAAFSARRIAKSFAERKK